LRIYARVAGLSAALVAASSPLASAEAFKSTSMGQVLGAVFIFGAGIPMGIGAGATALAWALRGHKPRLLLAMSTAVGAWWLGLLMASGEGFFDRLWMPFLLSAAGSGLVAFGASRPPEPPNADDVF